MWRSKGLCWDTQDGVFFPQSKDDERAAKTICAACPVRITCREWGIAHEAHGIWGGLSEGDRKRVRRARSRIRAISEREVRVA